jgi:predicted nuclease with TOPRIM domain
MPSEELVNAKAHLQALDAFLGSRAYVGFTEARREELKQVQDSILNVDPIDRQDEIEHFKLRGEMRVLEEMLTTFEGAAEELRDRIADLEEEEEGSG